MKGIIAQKLGMTRVICPDTGKITPVTVLFVPEAEVLQVKTVDTDGYSAVVLGGFPSTKKLADKGNISNKFAVIKELDIDTDGLEKGAKVSLDGLEDGMEVKISGTSKGRGFSGVIKRHNFARGRETHGSHHHREPGSVGMCAKPGRILKGKKMPGHYGVDKITLKTKIVQVDTENKLVAVRGAVPGAKKGYLTLIG
ncbi:50S ribosomal protein L3 [bacterium DOLZORAL124_38_8]|nr:MAG: 50S ribosomal protein L3 [bacterium DOLZORAL124_38_8]